MTLKIGLPSKGRIKEDSLAVFTNAGLQIIIDQDARRYTGTVNNYPEIEIAFLSASEIARELSVGTLDLGITGEDLVKETIENVDETIEICKRLDFGYADVVLAVPNFWYDVDNLQDLAEVAANFRNIYGRRMKIATKFWQLTQQFLTDQNGITSYRIVNSAGATEGAPALGIADIIVDITSTGNTIRANHLKILDDGVILKSQSCLFANKKSKNMDLKDKLVNILKQ